MANTNRCSNSYSCAHPNVRCNAYSCGHANIRGYAHSYRDARANQYCHTFAVPGRSGDGDRVFAMDPGRHDG